MKRSAIITLALFIAICAITLKYIDANSQPATRLQGQIMTQQYSISSKVAGRIESIEVSKGDRVSKGDLIFTIYSPEIEAKLVQAIAGQEAAGALAEEAEKGARSQQISASKDQWKKAQAAAELAEKTFKRVDNLFKDGVVAEQKRDEAFTQWQAAKYSESAAYQMYALALEGARSETKRAANEKAKAAAGAVAEVQAYAQDTSIESWFDGEVSQVLLHSGELAPQGFPVVTVVDTQDSWAVFNVREDLLHHFEKDRRFTAFVPALNKDVEFRVSHIAVMGDFATWRATDSSQGFDLRTFEVEARPTDPTIELRMGMSVGFELDDIH